MTMSSTEAIGSGGSSTASAACARAARASGALISSRAPGLRIRCSVVVAVSSDMIAAFPSGSWKDDYLHDRWRRARVPALDRDLTEIKEGCGHDDQPRMRR